MTEKILVPLDGSRVGEAALPCVKDLVLKLLPGGPVEVTLIQVVSQLVHYVVVGEEAVRAPYTPDEIEQLKTRANSYLEQAGTELRAAGAEIRLLVVVGRAVEEIIAAADDLGAGMIAMSSHGRSGLSRLAFGSVTDRVLHGSNRPVLVVKAAKDLQQA